MKIGWQPIHSLKLGPQASMAYETTLVIYKIDF
jgi:hypothetical protein